MLAPEILLVRFSEMKDVMAQVGDSMVVLQLFNKKYPAVVSTAGELTQGLNAVFAEQGSCFALPCRQMELSVTGMDVQNHLLSGEVVS